MLGALGLPGALGAPGMLGAPGAPGAVGAPGTPGVGILGVPAAGMFGMPGMFAAPSSTAGGLKHMLNLRFLWLDMLVSRCLPGGCPEG